MKKPKRRPRVKALPAKPTTKEMVEYINALEQRVDELENESDTTLTTVTTLSDKVGNQEGRLKEAESNIHNTAVLLKKISDKYEMMDQIASERKKKWS